MRYIRQFLTRSQKAHCCPICGSRNFTEIPHEVEGPTHSIMLGYDRQFDCGFATHWRGHRVSLCVGSHPHKATIVAINGVANGAKANGLAA